MKSAITEYFKPAELQKYLFIFNILVTQEIKA